MKLTRQVTNNEGFRTKDLNVTHWKLQCITKKAFVCVRVSLFITHNSCIMVMLQHVWWKQMCWILCVLRLPGCLVCSGEEHATCNRHAFFCFYNASNFQQRHPLKSTSFLCCLSSRALLLLQRFLNDLKVSCEMLRNASLDTNNQNNPLKQC